MSTVAEDFLLLTQDESSGRSLLDSSRLEFCLGGALLLDLALRERVALVDERVSVVDDASTGSAALDDPGTGSALLDVAVWTIAHERPREPDHWVRHLGAGAREAVEDGLVAQGVLRRDDHRALGLVPVHRTPVADARIEHDLLDRLNAAVVLDRPPAAQTAAVASLVLAAGLERHVFPRSDHDAVRVRITQMADTALSGQRWAVQAVRQAIMGLDAHLGRVP
jgi:hypothetical protein